MAYTEIDRSSEYFNTVLYTGTGSARTITGVGFQPDWVWVKDRTSANSHYLYDVLRGNNLNLFTNDTSAEVNVTTGQNGGGVGSQASDGFTIVAGVVGTDNVNTSGNLYASWNWKANGAGVSNTDGTISSTVSANTTSGFSIVSYTGTGANATVGHGLGVAPSMIIVKSRSYIEHWQVYHASLGATKYMQLSTTEAVVTASTRWNNTEPTSSVFSIGNHGSVNQSSGTLIAYCFAEKKGFSKAFSYTGNGSADGVFLYCGFKPKFILLKANASGYNWLIYDTARNTYNAIGKGLFPDSSNAEYDYGNVIDCVSNGFKFRSTVTNEPGISYIGFAIAEHPFVTSTGIPSCAR